MSQRSDWTQKWRTPLRKALDLIRDRADTLFEERGSAIFKKPWEARNDYVKVVLEDRPKIGPFFKDHGLRHVKKEQNRRSETS